MSARWVPNPAGQAEFFVSLTGPVGREVYRRGTVLLVAARRQVGVAVPDPLGRARDRRVGQLRDSLTIQPIASPLGPSVRVGSADPIALLHHEGSRPHTIFPRRRDGVLHFYWPQKNTGVFLRKVNHPGTAPNRYLSDNLHLTIT
ncbi:hypothetical protein [Frankia sp. AvcI1]|uniref:hypothetical protein n=1 Tax=Frankia sp. AvcI1 TaxID=573496 RepID=UPI00211744F6|nr:hypothetical protein [Frankia sp. AvcI1]